MSKLEVSYHDQFGEGEREILYLVMPPVTNFIVERNGANLDYAWDALAIHNVRYEVRVGVTAAWETARTIFTTKINKHRYVYPNTGDCYMLVKAIDEHGNYSRDAAYYFLTNGEDIHRNVILRLDQEAQGYPGAKRNLYYDATEQALRLEGSATEGAYLIGVQLPQKYGATGDISGVEVKTEIAVETEASRQAFSALLPLAGTLAGTNAAATGKGRVAYKAGRWHGGLLLNGMSRVEASVAIPAQFGLVFWLKLQGELPCTDFVRLVGAAGSLTVGYDSFTGTYALTGSDGVTLCAAQPYRAQAHLFVGIAQTEKERTFYLYALATGTTETRTAAAAPIGAFDAVRFEKDNMILDVGYDWIRQMVFRGVSESRQINAWTWSASTLAMNTIVIGSGGTGDTATVKSSEYGVQKFLGASEATVTFDPKDVRKVKLVAVFERGNGTGTITEAGVCNKKDGFTVGSGVNKPGQILQRTVFSCPAQNILLSGDLVFLDRVTFPENPVEKAADDTYTVMFRFTLGELKTAAEA